MAAERLRARILMVDDSRTERAFFRDILEAEGYEVFEARDGSSCLEELPSVRPELILLDVVMPGIDGYETCRRIKADERWRDIPVVFLSALDEGLDKSRAFEAGAVDYVTKPIDVAELKARIQTQLVAAEARMQGLALTHSLERGISEKTAELQTLIDTLPDLVWMKSVEGIFLYCNTRFASFLGTSRDHIIGRTDFDFLAAQEAEFFREQDRRVIAARAPIMNEEEVAFASDGHRELVESVKTPVLGADGSVLAVLGIGRDITGRKRIEKELRQSLEEKDSLIRELYHRTKNSLQLISAMVSLQAKSGAAAEAGEARLRELSRTIENRIQAIALVHEMLYESRDLSRISMPTYVGELVAMIRTSYDVPVDRIGIELEVEELSFLIDTAVPLGIMLNELITNSLKHAFPGGRKGRIAISMARAEPGLNVMRYEDDGVGLPPGFDFRNQKTLGLQLLCSIGEGQMNGRLEIDGSRGLKADFSFHDDLYEARV